MNVPYVRLESLPKAETLATETRVRLQPRVFVLDVDLETHCRRQHRRAHRALVALFEFLWNMDVLEMGSNFVLAIRGKRAKVALKLFDVEVLLSDVQCQLVVASLE